MCLVCVGAALAVSSATATDEPQAEGFPASADAFEAATAGAVEAPTPADSPSVPGGSAAGEGRAEAESTLQRAFGGTIEGAARAFDSLEVAEFRSDRIAVVEPPSDDAPLGLLSSVLPLRAANDEGRKELVDLGLEASGDHLEPQNPLVEAEIPSQLSDGISLPDVGIDIGLGQALSDRTASVLGGAAAFYPNVRPDTDVAIAAAPTGVETYTQLRSADAPTEQVLEVDLPAGEQLRMREGGGAEAVDASGSVTLSVAPPAAMDAAGNAVPASLRVADGKLILSVDPSPGAAYPILLDPLFQSFDWRNFSSYPENQGWVKQANPGFTAGSNTFGAVVYSQPGSTTPGNQGYWNYYVPRYWADTGNPSIGEAPTSFIRDMKLWNLAFHAYGTAPYPFAQMGLYSDAKQQFVSFAARYGNEGDLNDPNHVYDLPNPAEATDVKRGGFALATWDSSIGQLRELSVGQASVEVSDKDTPQFAEALNVSEWVGAKAGGPIQYKVSDPGLGVFQVRFWYPKAEGGTAETFVPVGCTGTAQSPCPRSVGTAGYALPYEPSLMPQGEDWLQVYAADPVWNLSGFAGVRVKVDRTKPALSVAGTLTEQAQLGTRLSQYSLEASAGDGDETTPSATSPIGSFGTSPGQFRDTRAVATDSVGNLYVADRLNNRVEKFDPSGKLLMEFGTAGSGAGQLSEPCGIAVTSAGNIWVAEMGNKRVQEFNPKGESLRTISSYFAAPYGIAAGPNETLWITDLGAHTVLRFRESGAYLGSVTGAVPSTYAVTDIETDAFGDAWAVEQTTSKVLEFAPNGEYRFSFGSNGTGDGQMREPNGIAVAASGNLLVTDSLNGRVQEFKPDGTFLRKFGEAGSASSQLSIPRGIASGSGNTAYIADQGNFRVAKWAHADRDPQSGAAKVEVKIDGAPAATKAPGCTSKNCSIQSNWTLDADAYPVGAHTVEVSATDAVGLSTTKTLNVETHGDRTAPTVAISGSMTEQGTLGTTRPSYKLKLSATDPGPAEERKSGIASTAIKVDGTVVDSASPGCPNEGCAMTREWTLNSDSFAAGAHTVEARATDAAGRTTWKTFTINIVRDSTAPQLQATSTFYAAPEGWLEQKTYSYDATATDAGGYGITSLSLKIDGAVVKTLTQACAAGGCNGSFGTAATLDMSAYRGGSHAAELIATDGAGNTSKKAWTINIDPAGAIPPLEAEATIEAAETTGSDEILASEEPGEPTLALAGESIESAEAPVPTSMTLDISEGFEMETADGMVSIEPVNPAPGASELTLSGGASSGVSANTAAGTDSIIRPVYDGTMLFQAIRGQSGPETFSWTVNMEADQSLQLINDEFVQVYTEGVHPSFGIRAIPAHDAVGSVVPTSLSVSGNVITLTVHHRQGNPAAGGAPFVYPVSAGTGWEGGFVTVPVPMPPPENDPEYVEGPISLAATVGAPVPSPTNEPGEEASASSSGSRYVRTWRVDMCPSSICSVWDVTFKGFFYYDFHEAWFPNNRDPFCSYTAYFNYSVDMEQCAWVGPNHQPYGHGYHVTARTLWTVAWNISGFTLPSSKHVVGRAFGSGNIYFHDTADICNPSRPDC